MTEPILVALDMGYSYVKAITENNQKLFQNLVTTSTGKLIRENVSLSAGTDTKHLDVFVKHGLGEDKRYYVGDKAVGDGHLVNAPDRLNTEYGRVSALTALALLAENDNENFIVATGLPVEHYRSYLYRDYIEKFPGEYSVTFNDGPLRGTTRNFTVSAVRVYKQGQGVFFDQVLEFDGTEKENHPLLLEDNSINIIMDVGSLTTNIGLYRNATALDISTSINDGIRKVYFEDLKATLVKYFPSMTDGDLDYAFQRDSISVDNNQSIDLKSIREIGLKKLATLLDNEIDRLTSPYKMYLNKLYVAGGGGKALFDFTNYPNKELVDDPQFSNARGFLKALNLAHQVGKVG